jgi:hypothetical protein
MLQPAEVAGRTNGGALVGHGWKGLVTVKIEAMNGEPPEPFEYGNVFTREEVGGRARLRVGLDEGQEAAVATLARTLRGPFQLLSCYTRLGPSQRSAGTRARS